MAYTLASETMPTRAPVRPRTTPVHRRKNAYRRISVNISGRRFYHPGVGRWINRDPLGDIAVFCPYVKDMHRIDADTMQWISASRLYLFVRNAPLNRMDLIGMADEDAAPPEKKQKAPDQPCCLTPGMKAVVDDIYNEAAKAQRKHFKGEATFDPYGGKYRHCVGGCLTGQKFGTEAGRAAICAWDLTNEMDPKDKSNQGDMEAEQVGLNISAIPKISCEEACLMYYPNTKILKLKETILIVLLGSVPITI